MVKSKEIARVKNAVKEMRLKETSSQKMVTVAAKMCVRLNLIGKVYGYVACIAKNILIIFSLFI